MKKIILTLSLIISMPLIQADIPRMKAIPRKDLYVAEFGIFYVINNQFYQGSSLLFFGDQYYVSGEVFETPDDFQRYLDILLSYECTACGSSLDPAGFCTNYICNFAKK
ncbi:hypothetical protein UFOVP80_40 [uncultured Caudovirales phage]|uniref:Uncharacterized protein n=1 Tax=uncultured Caudovirales phage TaxID=2100421 RepID=A0A6J5L043_9CAUD|nr:hypothetical protein UFOVP80_40 [uncultured Caudovirales phage]